MRSTACGRYRQPTGRRFAPDMHRLVTCKAYLPLTPMTKDRIVNGTMTRQVLTHVAKKKKLKLTLIPKARLPDTSCGYCAKTNVPGIHLDTVGVVRTLDFNVLLDGSTHPCGTEQCGGGVGRNMAEALWRMRGGRTRLLTAIGDDADGKYLDSIAPGLILDGCVTKNARTPSYAAVLDAKGECLLGLGDMVLHDHISPEMVCTP
ncbi:unnamed protein product [Chrysodeixis includens]|uniref:Carbohydrate kinase PfkB domain-containing protein n=1 Tax=Chrysodeixis includens TaxID=689277 RepID=A0A9N8KS29_CHRIL|nr:unnamed protein product [Chrysodeixis includens]